jgi:hypothetical protein
MDGLVFWMAGQVCPLLPAVGIQCGGTSDQYLIGVAGWIFSGVAILALMGFCERFARNRRMARSSPVPNEASLEQGPPLPSDGAFGIPPQRRKRVRRIRRPLGTGRGAGVTGTVTPEPSEILSDLRN